MTDIPQKLRSIGLVRRRPEQIVAGVCAGLGRRFGLEPWPTRLLFFLVFLPLPGSVLIAYGILWILMPTEQAVLEATPVSSAPPATPGGVSSPVGG